MNEFIAFQNMIEQQILNIHTAYLGKVLSINGNTARIQPLSMYKARGGKAEKPSTTTAVIPPNIKYQKQTITYLQSINVSKTITVLVPDSLAAGDVVYVGVCDRDITNAKKGIISEATNRHHNVNDGVILQVVR